MPIDLIAAVVAWLVAASGDAGIRLVRGSRDKRMLREAMQVAVDAVVQQADPTLRNGLRSALAECFSAPPVLQPDGTTPVGDWLRAAIAAQVTQLATWMNNDSQRPFLEDVPVDIGWLAERLTEVIIEALRQVVARGGLPELVRGVDSSDVQARLDALGSQLRLLNDSASAETTPEPLREAKHTQAEPDLPRNPPSVTSGTKADWTAAVMAFQDMDDPEFRRTVLRLMADRLGLAHTFETSYRPMARDHVLEIIDRCWAFKNKDAARRALADTLISLRPNERAAGELAQLATGTR
jgi:hypothetical protein